MVTPEKNIPRNDIPGFQLFSDLVRYETRLYNALEERIRPAHGLSLGQYDVLRLIADGDARTVGEVASQVAITVGAASKAVDRLEDAGWIARSPNPRNRRSSLLDVTEAGAALLEEAGPTVAAALRALVVDPLTAPARKTLTDTLATLDRALAAARER